MDILKLLEQGIRTLRVHEIESSHFRIDILTTSGSCDTYRYATLEDTVEQLTQLVGNELAQQVEIQVL